MRRHGRRDAKRGLRAGEDASLPYLEALRADAEAGQRAVSMWLHRKIAPIDGEAVGVLTLLDQHRRNPASPPQASPATAAADLDPRPAARIPTWVLEARRVSREQLLFDRRISERDAAEQRLSTLGSTRRNVIEIARAAAKAHTSRYQALAGLYRTAFRCHHPNRDWTEVSWGLPGVENEPWVEGVLPLLVFEIDTELTETYRWVLKEFESTTAAPGVPRH